MKKRNVTLALVSAFAAFAMLAPAAGAATASAKAESSRSSRSVHRPFLEVHEANLTRIKNNPAADGGSNASGRVVYIRIFDRLIVLEYVNGLAPGLPHAQHVHGLGLGQCPTPDRAGADGIINTAEGQPDYGMVVTSLTTNGDTTPASALAVDRFPVANQSGLATYVRVLRIGTDIPADIGYNIQDYATVVHGVDVNHNGMYDFDAGVSSLDPSLPLEATMPAACGQIN